MLNPFSSPSKLVARSLLAVSIWIGLANPFPVYAQTAESLPDLPFYFAAPYQAWANLEELGIDPKQNTVGRWIELGVADAEALTAGLRLLAVPEAGARGRREAVRQLHQAGLLLDGDVVLFFRPDWAGTMAYPHVQMGISHAGVIRTGNGTAYNLDMPLEPTFNGSSYSSQLDSPAYMDLQTFHILRPRGFAAEEQTGFRKTVERLVQSMPVISRRGLLPFQGDYMLPHYVSRQIHPTESVRRFGQVAFQPDTASSQPMYCSEFVWHVHSLARSGNQGGDVAAEMIFPPLPFVSANGEPGLGEGPLTVLTTAGSELSVEQSESLVRSMFEAHRQGALSQGHLKTAQQVAPLMQELEQFYLMTVSDSDQITVGGQEVTRREYAGALNQMIAPNYSPTAFYINTFLAPDDPNRRFDYLYTLTFISGEGASTP